MFLVTLSLTHFAQATGEDPVDKLGLESKAVYATAEPTPIMLFVDNTTNDFEKVDIEAADLEENGSSEYPFSDMQSALNATEQLPLSTPVIIYVVATHRVYKGPWEITRGLSIEGIAGYDDHIEPTFRGSIYFYLHNKSAVERTLNLTNIRMISFND